MSKATAFLNRIEAESFFRHVGEPIDDESVKTVADWTACLASLDGTKWVNIGTSMMNRIFAVADATRDPDWMNRHWDSMVDTRKAKITGLLGPVLKPVMWQHKLPKSFEYTVVGQVLQAWLLTEFEDDPAAAWSEWIMQWYLAGHVPCGFTGAVPSGKSTDPTRLPDPAKGKLMVY